MSAGVGPSDVERAEERATLPAKLGVATVPVVAGSWITPDAEEPARARGVWRVTDGRALPPDEVRTL